jgi:hypothetical protein
MSETPKRNRLKTRTLVTTLQSLMVLPSISAAIGGDVLPEAILIQNILEEMLASLVEIKLKVKTHFKVFFVLTKFDD